MKAKKKCKIVVDLFLTLFLLLQMAFQVTGEVFHEWSGTGMILLMIVHVILNLRWYGSLWKGKYNLMRFFRTVINSSLVVVMLCMAYSGIVLSRHVFSPLPINSGMALARKLHLAGAYWGFVLMSIHLGLHAGMITGALKKRLNPKFSKTTVGALRTMAVVLAGYGAVCFYRTEIVNYLFLLVEFAFLDYDKNIIAVFMESISMMGLWIVFTYYGMKLLGKYAGRRQKKGRETQ